ncbi:MAG: hypothetical protein MUP85_11880 [Candidatus Lokiarchaeota archaeon]|nr:hypothetical protein [Candidatus Lokiarchaeota archaeon]
MNSNNNIFFEIPCLTEKSKSLSGLELQKKWFKKADKRYLGEALQKFSEYNIGLLDFIDVVPKIEGIGKDIRLNFRSGKFVGAIPLRSPDTGKQIGDFVVRPRYTSSHDHYSEYIDLVNLLESVITPEFKHSIPLSSNNNVKPPLYLESVKYVKILQQAVKINWNKFQNIKRIYNTPKSQVDWDEYAEKEFDPKMRLFYPCHENVLTRFHREFFELKFVYNIAKKEIHSSNTPKDIKFQLQNTFIFLDTKLKNFEERSSRELSIHNSDPLIIKKLKSQANKILKNNFEEITAWRIDYSILFERYVQFLFQQISSEIGAVQLNNYKIKRHASYIPPWSLNYLEPDIILIKDDLNFVIDAKYKSHLLNLTSVTETLKEEHRKDIHQLFAYSAFSKNKNKIGFLCYPTNEILSIKLNYVSSISNVENSTILLGIPMKISKMSNLKNGIIDIISEVEKNRKLVA